MTVSAAVMVHGPVYGVRLVPSGTPVVFGPGKQPPNGSGPSGTFGVATGHAPVGVGLGEGVGDGLGVGVGVGVGAGAATVTAATLERPLIVPSWLRSLT